MIKVLVVEDDAEARQTLRDLLTLEGFLGRCAATVSEASRMVESTRPDLILLDRVLPDGEGHLVASRMCASCSNVPIVVVTACGDDNNRDQARVFGARDYATKPYHPDDLLRRIEQVLSEDFGNEAWIGR